LCQDVLRQRPKPRWAETQQPAEPGKGKTMRPPEKFEKIIDKKRYSTSTATLLCGNDHWDGHNHERGGTNQFLYKSPRGSYFFVHLTQWEGHHDSIQPCTQDEAIEFFEMCREDCQRVSYDESFPNVKVEEA